MIVFGTGKKSIASFYAGGNQYELIGSYFSLYYMPVFPTGKKLYTQVGGGWVPVELNSPDGQMAMNQANTNTGYGIGFWYGGLVIGGLVTVLAMTFLR